MSRSALAASPPATPRSRKQGASAACTAALFLPPRRRDGGHVPAETLHESIHLRHKLGPFAGHQH